MNNSYEAQRTKLLEHLQSAGATGYTTIQSRERLGIISLAPRIYELHHRYDHNIQTFWTHDTNAQGKRHHVGRYVLLAGKWKGAGNGKV